MKTLARFFVLYFLLTALHASAQEPICTWGETMENNSNEFSITGILGHDESGFYVMKESGPVSNHHIWLEKYNNAYKKLYSVDVSPAPGTFNDGQYFNKLLFAKSKFLVFSQTWSKDKAKSGFNVREVALDGTIGEKSVDLDEHPAEKQLKMGDFIVSLSPDKSKLLILSQVGFEKGSMEKAGLKVYDVGTWKELWKKEIDFAVEASRNPKNKIMVDNNGDAYLYKETSLEKGVFKRTLYTYNTVSSKLEEKNIDFGAVYAPYVDLRFNSKGDLVLSGFYTHSNNMEMAGTYYFRIDGKTKAIVGQKNESLGKDIFSNFMNEKNAVKPTASLDNFKFHDALIRSDESTLFVIEYSTLSKSAVANTGGAGVMPEYDYTYTSKEVVLICVDKDGNRKWHKVFSKQQNENTRNPNRRYDSFVYGLFNDEFVIIWNHIDLNKMLIPVVMGVPAWEETDGKVYKKHIEFGKMVPYAPFMDVISSTGEQRYKNLKFGLPLKKMHESSPFEMSMNTNVFYQMEDGIILYSETNADGRRIKFGKIKL